MCNGVDKHTGEGPSLQPRYHCTTSSPEESPQLIGEVPRTRKCSPSVNHDGSSSPSTSLLTLLAEYHPRTIWPLFLSCLPLYTLLLRIVCPVWSAWT
jgi:hypothetical protein